MKRIILVLLAMVLLIACVFVESQAWPWSRKKDNRPLYVDPTGWEIISALPGWKIVQKYEQYESAGYLAEISESTIPRFQPYISSHGSSNFYGFALVVQDNVVTYWNQNSGITLIYTCDEDTLQVTSCQYFFASITYNKLIFDYELVYPFSVPNPSFNLYATSKGNPVLFARFDFGKKEPERLLSCVPENVRSAVKDVSRR